ncbi:hypothetical protein ABZ917_13580 [Nonomuraea wenchangensis]
MTALEHIDRLYTCAQECEIWDQPVEHAAARTFVFATTKLLRELSDAQTSDLWNRSALLLRQTRRLVCTIPLPFSDPQMHFRSRADQLARHALRLDGVADPVLVDALSRTASSLAHLAACDEDPLGDCVRDFITLDNPLDGIVVIRDRQYVQAVGESMARNSVEVRVGTEADLAGREVYPSAASVGPPRWMRPGLLNAPRAHYLALVHYNFFREEADVEALLYGPATSTDVVRPVLKASPFLCGAPEVSPTEPTDLLMTRECSLGEEIQVAFPRPSAGGGLSSARNHVQARAALLSDGSHVLLPTDTDSDARILTLRVEKLPEIRVEHISASAVGCGDHLALRNRPHHEDLVGRADALLGPDAESLRNTQSLWKNILWERTEAHPRGIGGVADELRLAGASTANVSYWVSDWCIRPRSKADFAVVLRFLGITADVDEIWERLRRIDSAHRRAGHRYVNDIQQAATPERVALLMTVGWCAMTLAGADSETVLARVEHILPEPLQVPLSALCRLRKPEDSR